MGDGKLVHLYPTGQAFVHDWPTAEIDVTPEQVEELLAYQPAVYSTEPTGWPPAPEPAPATDSQEA